MEDCTALLERAVGYALYAVRPVTAAALGRPTPCAEWDVRALLWHAADSLDALYEGVRTGYVALDAPAGEFAADPGREPRGPGRLRGPCDPVTAFRAGASRLLGAWSAAAPGGRPVTVGHLPLAPAALARTGALEIAVHGWDIARSVGKPRPVPAALATELMRVARQSVPGPAARPPLFGPPLPLSAGARPGDRLVAFLGRDPYAAPHARGGGSARGGSREGGAGGVGPYRPGRETRLPEGDGRGREDGDRAPDV